MAGNGFYVPSVQAFRGLTEAEATFALREHLSDRDQIAHTYANWHRGFTQRIMSFYRSEGITLQIAAEAYGIPRTSGVIAPTLATYESLIESYAIEHDEPLEFTFDTVIDGAPMIDYMKAQLTGEFTPWKYRDVLYAYWFNYVAVPPVSAGDEVVRLRTMPYDQYLKSEHWRRVRCAMLIAYHARCSRKGCSQSEELHYLGDQADLHVHHKTYANRGNERFDDLELLCVLCHRREHGRA